jgi:plastocyanin
VSFTAADDDGEHASGVDFTEYSVDGGVWQQGDSVEVTEDGEHAVRYRSTDNEGNREVAKAVSFSIDKPNTVVKDVFAGGTTWTPDELDIPWGETVTWHWEEGSGQPHNVGLVAPETDPKSPQLISDISVPPDSDPVSYTFRKQGTWEFVCTLHSSFNQTTQEWTGMVGTVDVAADPAPDESAPVTSAALAPAPPAGGAAYATPVTVTLNAEDAAGPFPSGVTKTEYRINGGGWTASETVSEGTIVTTFTVSDEGAYTIEYRSTDAKGNVEETKSIAFTIDKPDAPPPGDGGGNNPPPNTGPQGNPPASPPATATALKRLPKRTLASFAERGIVLTSACESGLTGKVQIALSSKQAKRLGLKKATVLASKKVTCAANDQISVKLKPSKKLAKKLKKGKKSISATVKLTLGSGAAKSSDSAKLVLKRK